MLLPPLLLLLPLLWAVALAQDLRTWLRLQERVTVQEGQCALVPCDFSYPRGGYSEHSPAYGYWYREEVGSWGPHFILVTTNHPLSKMQTKTQGRFHLLGDPQTYSCSLDIRDARREDTGTYYFMVERGPVSYSYGNQPLSVTVTALTHRPDIHLQGPLQAGRPSNITCAAPWACERGTLPTFSWRGVGLSATGTDSPVLTLSPGPQHHGSSLTCRVTFPAAGVSTETTVRLTVTYAPQNLAIQVIREEGSGPEALGNGSSLPVREGQSLRLACVVHSSPPARLTWLRGNLTVKSSPSLNPVGAVGTWEHPQTLELELARVHLEDHGKLLCHAQNPLGSQEASLSLSVEYAPQNLTIRVIRKEGSEPEALGNGSSLPVQEGQSLRLACVVHSSPPANLTWVQGNLTVKSSLSLTPVIVGGAWEHPQTLELELAGVRLEDHGKLLCHAQNPLGSQEASLSLFVEKPPPPTSHSPSGSRGIVQGHQGGSWSDSPPHPWGPAVTPSEEEQELHYASLGLPKANPRAFLVQEASEYAQIKGAALS
ncbi:sialic acid-binding Ig-like lectin 13 [Talpa occidentalis]|uniref:sialic acid-binding Ig-like lectin 13 n=1 Tax=Talpa occidentalis TaxID=50954 RepID=UPI0023F6B1CE|nr:sialic acid-binding Ig-like lectin 13 [Talpa occidentalis]